jgi:hypothetical protein
MKKTRAWPAFFYALFLLIPASILELSRSISHCIRCVLGQVFYWARPYFPVHYFLSHLFEAKHSLLKDDNVPQARMHKDSISSLFEQRSREQNSRLMSLLQLQTTRFSGMLIGTIVSN